MDNEKENAKDSGFGTLRVEGVNKVKAVGHDQTYNRAKLFNPVTQQREEIVLLDMGAPENEDLMPVESQLELHADLTKAFSVFTFVEKRFLIRVLLQGQSVDEAAKGSKLSRRRWADWMQTKAMPVLKDQLSDYFKDGKVTL